MPQKTQDFVVAESLKRFSQNGVPINEKVLRHIQIQKVDVGSHLFRQGDSTDLVGLVLQGLFRVYYLNQDGEQKIKRFIGEGQLISPMPSILRGETAIYSAEAIEVCTVAYLHYQDLDALASIDLDCANFCRRGLEEALVFREYREYELFMHSPEQRYQNFLRDFHGLEERVSQKDVASYLGITAVSLSRIRKRMGRN